MRPRFRYWQSELKMEGLLQCSTGELESSPRFNHPLRGSSLCALLCVVLSFFVVCISFFVFYVSYMCVGVVLVVLKSARRRTSVVLALGGVFRISSRETYFEHTQIGYVFFEQLSRAGMLYSITWSMICLYTTMRTVVSPSTFWYIFVNLLPEKLLCVYGNDMLKQLNWTIPPLCCSSLFNNPPAEQV